MLTAQVPTISIALRPFIVTLVLYVTTTVHLASAQHIALNQYQGAPTADDGFGVMRPVVPGHLRSSVRLQFDYANDPLVFEDVRGDANSERTAIVRDQLTANVALSIGLGESALVYAGLPVHVLMKGDPFPGLPRASGTGLGDGYIGGRAAFAPDGSGGPMVAVDAQLSFPSASAANRGQQLAGESGVAGALRAMFEGSIATLRLGFVAGLSFRPDTFIAGLPMRDELLFDLSLMQPLLDDVLFAHLEVSGKSSRDDVGRTATTPVSGLLGLRLRVGGLTFGLAGGAGIVRGYGAPDARVVFSAAVTVPAQTTAALPPDEASPPVEEPAVSRTSSRPLGVDESLAAPSDQASIANPTEEPSAAPTAPVDASASDQSAVDPLATPMLDATPPPAPAVRPHASGRVVDSDADRVGDDVDQCPRAPGAATHQGCPEHVRLDLDRRLIEVVREIKFGSDGTAVLGRSFPTLEDVLAILKANPDMRIRVESHIHNAAPAATSLTLTQARAGGIRDLLIEWEVDPARLSAYGCGSIRPISPNDKPWGRKANDRIEFHIVAVRAAAPAGCQASP